MPSNEPAPHASRPPDERPAVEAASRLRLDILPQPDDITCGPTCLQAVYRFFGDGVTLEQVVAEVRQLSGGGTLAALLGAHALRRGYRAQIFTFDLSIFDPTWLPGDNARLIERLRAQAEIKTSAKHLAVTRAYLEFLRLGGMIRFEDLTRGLIRRYLVRKVPIIAGLSSTYLYRAMREVPETNADDDLRGEPGGHFVVLHGYDPASRSVSVADPYAHHPFPGEHRYEAPIDRVVCAILLGVVTYDANLLVVEPPPRRKALPPATQSGSWAIGP